MIFIINNKSSATRFSRHSSNYREISIQETREGQTSNMAARGVFRSVWCSFAGLKLCATGTNSNPILMRNAPQLSALAIQSRGIREGEIYLKTTI